MFNLKCAIFSVTGVLVGIVAVGCASGGDEDEQPVVVGVDNDSVSTMYATQGDSGCLIHTAGVIINACVPPSRACGTCPAGTVCTMTSEQCTQVGCHGVGCFTGGAAVSRIVCPTGYRYCSLRGQCVLGSYYSSVCR